MCVCTLQEEDLEVAAIVFFVEIDGAYHTAIAPWITESQEEWVRKCTVCDDAILIDSNRIVESIIYCDAPVGSVATLFMPAISRFGLHPKHNVYKV